MDLLTTYTHDSELQAITALSLTATLYKSPQYALRNFPTCCVFINCSLATASNSGESSAQVLSSQPPLQNSTELKTQLSQTQSQSHIATNGQSISKSWCRNPSEAHDQIFITHLQLRSCFCEAASLTSGFITGCFSRKAQLVGII
jgi:hypothetical protein